MKDGKGHDMTGTGIRGRVPAILAAAAACFALLVPAGGPGTGIACVGRTIVVGYYDAPDQVMVANILAVFIDERTGTTVRLSRYGSRDEAFEAIRRDRISLFADYSGIVLSRYGGEAPGTDPEKNVSRVKELLNRKYNVLWLEPFGYDRVFPPGAADAPKKEAGAPDPGAAGLMLCKDSLSRFPALPRLLGKLRGVLDNGTMEELLHEAARSDPKAVARKFLKSRKLI